MKERQRERKGWGEKNGKRRKKTEKKEPVPLLCRRKEKREVNKRDESEEGGKNP